MSEENQEPILLQVEESDADRSRLDRFLTGKFPEFSRSKLQSLIKDGFVMVNGRKVKAKQSLEIGDQLEITPPEEISTEVLGEDIPLEVLFEDESILVINKPGRISGPSWFWERNGNLGERFEASLW